MYIDICGMFGLCQTSFYNPYFGPLWPIIKAIDCALQDVIVQFPTDERNCRKAAEGFARFSRDMLKDCVCAVDDYPTNNLVVTPQIISYFPPQVLFFGLGVRLQEKWNHFPRLISPPSRTVKASSALLKLLLAIATLNFFFSAKHTGSTNDVIAIQGNFTSWHTCITLKYLPYLKGSEGGRILLGKSEYK